MLVTTLWCLYPNCDNGDRHIGKVTKLMILSPISVKPIEEVWFAKCSFLFVLKEKCSYNEITHPIKITKNPFWGQMIDSFISLVLSYRIIDIVWYHWFSQKSVFLNVLAVINVDYVKIGSWKRDRSGSFYLFDVKTDLWTQNNSTQFSQIETTDGYASKL